MHLDKSHHKAEAELHALITAAHPSLGTAVGDARAVGIPWLTIMQIIVQYGPQAMAIIRAIIDALKTPVQ